MDFEDHLGKAARNKHLAKQAIRDGRFDDAWGYLHDQKMEYINHANRQRFTRLQTLMLDSYPHIDMANILRLEGKHLAALNDISYAYKVRFESNGLTKSIEGKLRSYFKRAYPSKNYERFKFLLDGLGDADYISVRNFIKFFPLASDIEIDAEPEQTQEITLSQQAEHIKKTQEYVDNKIKSHQPNLDKEYPEPKYADFPKINKRQQAMFAGYPVSLWVMCILITAMILILFVAIF
ncbi:hypothetical protein J0904_02205 [Acinetobacter bereziniae]|uniref:hypothetical protein n=1 Tax=Acinetobacter bereziniae TaxID=106648 RepID=UPI00207544C9|nr:hypothetical protein [Acinetobacter bereziniae]MCM8510901.1 hypothetical protein [Acinetobacter bereziniae]